jgi:hypothetical protein
MKAARTTRLLLAASLALAIPPATSAIASDTAKLNVSLTPETLGAGTTISFDLRIIASQGEIPPPLTKIDLLYPANLGLIASGLGLSTCSGAELETKGRCPANALMGYGSALAEIPFEEVIFERARITTWMAPIENGHLQLLFLAKAGTPVSSEIIFTSLLLGAKPPFGGSLATTVPLVPTIPEGPDVAITQLATTLGPMHITYYETFHGKRVAYHPQGIRLPHTCPHGGFPFAATLAFLDGTHASAHTSVPCPVSIGGDRPFT